MISGKKNCEKDELAANLCRSRDKKVKYTNKVMATTASAVVMVIVMPHVASLDSIIRQKIAENPCLTMTLSFDKKKVRPNIIIPISRTRQHKKIGWSRIEAERARARENDIDRKTFTLTRCASYVLK